MSQVERGTALITGGSSGIGAVYADRLAGRGHDLILVARHRERLDALAEHLMDETGRSVRVMVADLRQQAERASVEHVLRTDPTITMLVNNAGMGAPGPFLDADTATLDRMIDLNVTALVRLTHAVVPAFLERGGGAIINMSSITGIAPEVLSGVYGGTKAFVLAFSLSLHKEFAGRKIRVQAVLPGAVATDFWNTTEMLLERLPGHIVMGTEDVVDAAMAGFEQGELVTIPSLPDLADWEAYEAARQNMMPKLSLEEPAPRYGVARARKDGARRSATADAVGP